MVAEFEQMEYVSVAFPLGVPVSLLKLFAEHVKVLVVVPQEMLHTAMAMTNGAGIPASRIEWVVFENDSYWIRDYGPWFVDYSADGGARRRTVVDHHYDILHRRRDNKVPLAIAEALSREFHAGEQPPLIHVGGNIMTDGYGVGFSTDLVAQSVGGHNFHGMEPLMETMSTKYGIHEYHVMADPRAARFSSSRRMLTANAEDRRRSRGVPDGASHGDLSDAALRSRR